MPNDQSREQTEPFQRRDQRFAIAAHERVTNVASRYENEPIKRNRYGAIAHSLPLLIHTNGLAQAISFVAAMTSKPDMRIYQDFLDDLAQTVGETTGERLQNLALTSDLGNYLRLTRDVLDALLWYKRFAQSILHVDNDNLDADKRGGV